MLPKTVSANQPNLFYSSLMDMLDLNDPLIALAKEPLSNLQIHPLI